jgi:hypothetical protein
MDKPSILKKKLTFSWSHVFEDGNVESIIHLPFKSPVKKAIE